MDKWDQQVAKATRIKHSDTIAVIRWGKLAKRATRRRNRRKSKDKLQEGNYENQ